MPKVNKLQISLKKLMPLIKKKNKLLSTLHNPKNSIKATKTYDT